MNSNVPLSLSCNGRRNGTLLDNCCTRRDVSSWAQMPFKVFLVIEGGQHGPLCFFVVSAVETERCGTFFLAPAERLLMGTNTLSTFLLVQGRNAASPCHIEVWASKRNKRDFLRPSGCFLLGINALFSDRGLTTMFPPAPTVMVVEMEHLLDIFAPVGTFLADLPRFLW